MGLEGNKGNVSNAQVHMDYADERKDRMSKFVVGAKDANGYEISYIYTRSDDFVIYGVKGVPMAEALRVHVDPKIESDEVIFAKNYDQIKDELDKVKFEIYRTGVDESYIQRVAHAIPLALRNEPDKAKALLKQIAADVIEEYKNRQNGRLFYMLGALEVSFITSVVAVITYLMRDAIFVSHNQALGLLVYAVAFSSFGGLLSISMRLKELTLEKVLPRRMYLTYGALRQLFSILGGISVIILIKAGLAFSIASDNIYAILSLCLLAGFSETLIPNTLRKIENEKA